jgi:hypothetical protein
MHKKILAKEKKYQKNKKKIQENTRTRTPLEPKHTDTRKGLGDGGGGGWVNAEEGGEGERTPSQLESTAMARQQATQRDRPV